MDNYFCGIFAFKLGKNDSPKVPPRFGLSKPGSPKPSVWMPLLSHAPFMKGVWVVRVLPWSSLQTAKGATAERPCPGNRFRSGLRRRRGTPMPSQVCAMAAQWICQGCGFSAYSWKLPAYSGVFFYLQLTILAFLLTIGASPLTVLASLLTVGAFCLQWESAS